MSQKRKKPPAAGEQADAPMNTSELPPKPDNYDELWEGEPHKAALLRKLRARAEAAEAAGQHLEGLQLTDYTEALEEHYEGSAQRAYVLEIIRQILKLADSSAWEGLADIDTDPLRISGYSTPGSWLADEARSLAGAMAYARAHRLEPLPLEESARVWTESYWTAYERTPLRTERAIERIRAGVAGLWSLEALESASEIIQNLIRKFHVMDVSEEHSKALSEAGIVEGNTTWAIELNPATLQPFDAGATLELVSTLGFAANKGMERGKLYVPVNVHSLWRAPTGIELPPHYLAALLGEPRTAAALGMGEEDDSRTNAKTLRIATGQIMQHMYRHVSSPELDTLTDLTIKQRGARMAVRARSSTNLQATLTTTTSELLEKMHRSILSVKRHGAALLKVQLDLMSQAYTAGGLTPLFHYDLSDALERQGYAHDDSRRAYDSETMQSLRERVATLAHQQVDVLNLTETDKKGRTSKYIDSTPYWVIEATRRRDEGDEVNGAIVLLADPNAPVVSGFTMRPGLWWQAVGVGDFYLDIPAAVLELPTHANSNEPERLALQLTPLLAIWERASQQQHAGKSTRYAAGTLLTEGGYTTREAFMTMHPTQAQRIRDYLASTDDTGAIPILNRLGAFSLEIEDEAAFFAGGRGWRERFWDTQVRLNIRDMQLPKKRALSRQRSRS